MQSSNMTMELICPSVSISSTNGLKYRYMKSAPRPSSSPVYMSVTFSSMATQITRLCVHLFTGFYVSQSLPGPAHSLSTTVSIPWPVTLQRCAAASYVVHHHLHDWCCAGYCSDANEALSLILKDESEPSGETIARKALVQLCECLQ